MHLIFEEIALEDRTQDWHEFPLPGNVLTTILHDTATLAFITYTSSAFGLCDESYHSRLNGLQFPEAIASNIEMQFSDALYENPRIWTQLTHRFRLIEGPADDNIATQRFHGLLVVQRLCTAWFRSYNMNPRMLHLTCICGHSMLKFGRWSREHHCSARAPALESASSPYDVRRLVMRFSAATLAHRSSLRSFL